MNDTIDNKVLVHNMNVVADAIWFIDFDFDKIIFQDSKYEEQEIHDLENELKA